MVYIHLLAVASHIHSLVIKNSKFRSTTSVDKKTLKNRYKIVYKETFQTSVPGTTANVIYLSRALLKNKKVLDLGCGAGRLSLFASRYAKHVTGIDYVDSAITYANQFAKLCDRHNVEFLTADLDSFTDKKYDVILISEVLQHVENPLRILKKCNQLLNKKGYVIVNIPSFNNFRGNVWLTLQNLFKLPMSLTDTYQLSTKEMKIFSKKAGFKLEKIIGMSYDWAWSEWGIDDLIRRVFLATKDAKLDKMADFKSMNKWLSSNLEPNKKFLQYLIKKGIVKTRPKFSLLKIPRSAKKQIRNYLDDGNSDINRFYCTIEPFNIMGAGAIYFLKK